MALFRAPKAENTSALESVADTKVSSFFTVTVSHYFDAVALRYRKLGALPNHFRLETCSNHCMEVFWVTGNSRVFLSNSYHSKAIELPILKIRMVAPFLGTATDRVPQPRTPEELSLFLLFVIKSSRF